MSDPIPVIETRVADTAWSDHPFRGYELFAELLGNVSMTSLLALALTGKRLDQHACGLLDDLAAALTMADPRIWPLKVTRIVGAYGEFIPAFAAGLLSFDHAAVGGSVGTPAAQQLQSIFERVQGRVDDAESVEEAVRAMLAEQPRLYGFGVPFRPEDERVVAMRRRLDEVGHRGPYWRLAEAVAPLIRRETKLEMNSVAVCVAVMLDLGLAVDDITPLLVMLFQFSFLANAVEAAKEPSGVLRELPAHCVQYAGVDRRESPRALKALVGTAR